jgi:hypothetical protein
MIPARVAIMPIIDQPQAPKSSPRRVSPWNSVAFSTASLGLFGEAIAAALTWEWVWPPATFERWTLMKLLA